MIDWLLENLTENTRCCVVMGRVDESVMRDAVESYPKGVLWFVDQEGFRGIEIESDQLLIAPLESISADDVAGVIDQFVVRDQVSLPGLKISRDVLTRQSDAYNFLMEKVQFVFESTLRSRNTRLEKGWVRQQLLIENLEHYFKNRLPAHLKDCCQGAPAIIVGAGPSLDATLPILKSYADKAVIFATDSALNALGHFKVKPDFSLNVDDGKRTAVCCPEDMELGCLLLSGISRSEWRELAAQQVWYLSGRFVTQDWLAANGISRTACEAAGNCGLCAITVAAFMGCSPLILLGMDMANDSKDPACTHNAFQRHLFPEQKKQDNARAKTKKIPGNYEDTVQTLFLAEWRETCSFLGSGSLGATVYNVTDRGAKLTGATLLRPDAFEETLGSQLTRPKPDLNEILDMGRSQTVDQKTIGNTWRRISKVCETARQTLLPLGSKRGDKDWPDRAYETLVRLFRDEDFSQLFGSYAMKEIPRLLSPDPLSRKDLEEILDNAQQLCELGIKQSRANGS